MPTPPQRPPWRLLAATVALLSAVACGAGRPSGPQTLPPLHPASATSPTEIAAPAVTPSPTMLVATSIGSPRSDLIAASAVVQRYYAVLNNLRRSMDANALAVLFTARCFCQQQVRAVRRAAVKHEHYVDQVHLNALTPNRDSPGDIDVLVDFDANRGGLVTEAGHRVTSERAQQDVERDFLLTRVHGHWRIAEISIV